jgi:biotin carboxylase
MSHIAFIDSNKAGLGAIRAAKRLGHRVTFLRSSDLKFLHDGAEFDGIASLIDRTVEIESISNIDKLTELLRKVNDEDPLDAVITVLEASVYAAAVASERIHVPCTSAEAIYKCRNKDVTRGVLKEADIPSAAYCVTHSLETAIQFANSIGYPVIVKPCEGLGSILTRRIYGDQEMKLYFDTIESQLGEVQPGLRKAVRQDILVEEFLVGPLMSAEIGLMNNEAFCFMVTQRKQYAENPSVELGSTMPAVIDQAGWSDIAAYAARVLNTLNLNVGIFHVELIMTKNGPRLVEVNARVMGGTMPPLFNYCTGMDIFEELINIHLGITPKLPDRNEMRDVSSRVLGSSQAAHVHDTLAVDWLHDLRNEFLSIDVPIEKGQAIRKMVNNYSSIGSFYISASPNEDSSRRADRHVEMIADKIGFSLC